MISTEIEKILIGENKKKFLFYARAAKFIKLYIFKISNYNTEELKISKY